MRKNHVKHLLAAALASASLLAAGSTVSAASHPDVNPGDWYYGYVTYVDQKGIMTGYADGRFGPGDDLTRGQFATILYRMEGSPKAPFDGKFPDVRPDAFYAGPIAWASQSKAITGYDNGNFGPDDRITREQVATILHRYQTQVKAGDGTARGDLNAFPDAAKVSPFAKDGILWSLGSKLITGDQGNVNPQGNASRAQIAAILQRFDTNLAPHVHQWVEKTVSVEVPTVMADWDMWCCRYDGFETHDLKEFYKHCDELLAQGIWPDGYGYTAHNVVVGTHREDKTIHVCGVCGAVKPED